jgi:hypothetical protein
MNSNQQGQGGDKSQSIGQDSQGGQGQQSQSGKQGQQGNQSSQGSGQQSQSGSQGQQGGQAGQRKEFDDLMSQSDQSLRDSTMQQGSDNKNRGGGSQSR